MNIAVKNSELQFFGLFMMIEALNDILRFARTLKVRLNTIEIQGFPSSAISLEIHVFSLPLKRYMTDIVHYLYATNSNICVNCSGMGKL